ncbi:MAG: hypothetical protein EZS28_015892 [Streblomastix strix]|uniref:Reverse transcriptase domain-containing protein n=1 Tax=Streblomastix strix TaxID=222440 RepID=A0A5J4W1A7_9EUKA|nr:MAG: hypothetical protein EZS28_015892 [Streblomastix strix]
MEENSGCEFTEQGDINDSLQDEWNRSGERFDQERRLGNKLRSKISISPPNTLSIFFTQALAKVLMKIRRESDIIILNYEDDLFILNQNKEKLREQTLIIMNILETFGQTIAQKKCETELKQQINFQGWTYDLNWMYQKMADLRKQELHFQLRKFFRLTERQVPIKIKYLTSIIGKLNFLRVQIREASLYLKIMCLAKTRALKNKEWKENMIFTQAKSSRAILVAQSDNEELRDDSRSESSRGSNSIRRISVRLRSDSGTTNRGCISTTWRMEHGTETLDNQQEGYVCYILRAIQLRINLQRAADQSDPHQVRQLYCSIRFNKTKSRINSGSGSEENSQTKSTTENKNSNSTYSRNIKQNIGRTKQIKYLGRLFSKERDIHSPVPSVVDKIDTGLVHNRGKQTRGLIHDNRRGRGRGRMVERVFETMEGGDLLDPPTNSEDWKSPDRLGKVQTKVNHDSTLVARSNMVHTLTYRQQLILYSWRELSDSEFWEGNDEKERYAFTKKKQQHSSQIKSRKRKKIIIVVPRQCEHDY